MDKELTHPFLPDASEEKAGSYSPLVLAFLGDTVYETAIRTMVVEEGQRPVNILNRKKNRFVKAHAQSAMMEVLLPMLTPEEAHIYKRGRNAKSATMAKNATMSDYRRATGFEALIGYLYLSGQNERMYALMEAGVTYLKGEIKKEETHEKRRVGR